MVCPNTPTRSVGKGEVDRHPRLHFFYDGRNCSSMWSVAAKLVTRAQRRLRALSRTSVTGLVSLGLNETSAVIWCSRSHLVSDDTVPVVVTRRRHSRLPRHGIVDGPTRRVGIICEPRGGRIRLVPGQVLNLG